MIGKRLLGVPGALAVLACLAGSAAGADPVARHDATRLASFAVGIFCPDGVGISPSDAPGTIKGTVDRMDRNPVLAIETQTVPALDGIMFGVQVREAVDNGTVDITVTHPPLGPDGLTTEGWSTQMETDSHTVHAYYLGLSDGDPTGRWRVVAMAGPDLLFVAEFDVVPAPQDMADPCKFTPVG